MNNNKNYGLIYKATCVINGKVYVGQTHKTLEQCIKGHKDIAQAGKDYPFPSAIREYGIENFIFEILEFCNSQEELDSSECKWIDALEANTYCGYNCTTGGLSNFSVNKESKEKMSDVRIGHNWSEDSKKKLSISTTGSNNPFYGHKHKVETHK